MGYELYFGMTRDVDFHILSSPHDPNPLIVTRRCHTINVDPAIDSFASCAR